MGRGVYLKRFAVKGDKLDIMMEGALEEVVVMNFSADVVKKEGVVWRANRKGSRKLTKRRILCRL